MDDEEAVVEVPISSGISPFLCNAVLSNGAQNVCVLLEHEVQILNFSPLISQEFGHPSKSHKIQFSHLNGPCCASWSPDGRIVAIACGNRFSLHDSTKSFAQVETRFLSCSPKDLDVCCLRDDQQKVIGYMVVVSLQTGAEIFRFPSSKQEADFVVHRRYPICCVKFSPDGNFLAVGCVDGRFAVWRATADFDGSKDIWYTTVPTKHRLTHISFSPDSRSVAVSSWASSVHIYRRATTAASEQLENSTNFGFLDTNFQQESELFFSVEVDDREPIAWELFVVANPPENSLVVASMSLASNLAEIGQSSGGVVTKSGKSEKEQLAPPPPLPPPTAFPTAPPSNSTASPNNETMARILAFGARENKVTEEKEMKRKIKNELFGAEESFGCLYDEVKGFNGNHPGCFIVWSPNGHYVLRSVGSRNVLQLCRVCDGRIVSEYQCAGPIKGLTTSDPANASVSYYAVLDRSGSLRIFPWHQSCLVQDASQWPLLETPSFQISLLSQTRNDLASSSHPFAPFDLSRSKTSLSLVISRDPRIAATQPPLPPPPPPAVDSHLTPFLLELGGILAPDWNKSEGSGSGADRFSLFSKYLSGLCGNSKDAAANGVDGVLNYFKLLHTPNFELNVGGEDFLGLPSLAAMRAAALRLIPQDESSTWLEGKKEEIEGEWRKIELEKQARSQERQIKKAQAASADTTKPSDPSSNPTSSVNISENLAPAPLQTTTTSQATQHSPSPRSRSNDAQKQISPNSGWKAAVVGGGATSKSPPALAVTPSKSGGDSDSAKSKPASAGGSKSSTPNSATPNRRGKKGGSSRPTPSSASSLADYFLTALQTPTPNNAKKKRGRNNTKGGQTEGGDVVDNSATPSPSPSPCSSITTDGRETRPTSPLQTPTTPTATSPPQLTTDVQRSEEEPQRSRAKKSLKFDQPRSPARVAEIISSQSPSSGAEREQDQNEDLIHLPLPPILSCLIDEIYPQTSFEMTTIFAEGCDRPPQPTKKKGQSAPTPILSSSNLSGAAPARRLVAASRTVHAAAEPAKKTLTLAKPASAPSKRITPTPVHSLTSQSFTPPLDGSSSTGSGSPRLLADLDPMVTLLPSDSSLLSQPSPSAFEKADKLEARLTREPAPISPSKTSSAQQVPNEDQEAGSNSAPAAKRKAKRLTLFSITPTSTTAPPPPEPPEPLLETTQEPQTAPPLINFDISQLPLHRAISHGFPSVLNPDGSPRLGLAVSPLFCALYCGTTLHVHSLSRHRRHSASEWKQLDMSGFPLLACFIRPDVLCTISSDSLFVIDFLSTRDRQTIPLTSELHQWLQKSKGTKSRFQLCPVQGGSMVGLVLVKCDQPKQHQWTHLTTADVAIVEFRPNESWTMSNSLARNVACPFSSSNWKLRGAHSSPISVSFEAQPSSRMAPSLASQGLWTWESDSGTWKHHATHHEL